MARRRRSQRRGGRPVGTRPCLRNAGWERRAFVPRAVRRLYLPLPYCAPRSRPRASRPRGGRLGAPRAPPQPPAGIRTQHAHFACNRPLALPFAPRASHACLPPKLRHPMQRCSTAPSPLPAAAHAASRAGPLARVGNSTVSAPRPRHCARAAASCWRRAGRPLAPSRAPLRLLQLQTPRPFCPRSVRGPQAPNCNIPRPARSRWRELAWTNSDGLPTPPQATGAVNRCPPHSSGPTTKAALREVCRVSFAGRCVRQVTAAATNVDSG